MKKIRKRFCLLSMLLSLTLLGGCAGLGDWASEPLPGGYEVWRMNAHGIAIIQPNESGSGGWIIIPEEVYALRYNDAYICVQHEDATPDEDDYWKEPHGELDYYILPSTARYTALMRKRITRKSARNCALTA